MVNLRKFNFKARREIEEIVRESELDDKQKLIVLLINLDYNIKDKIHLIKLKDFNLKDRILKINMFGKDRCFHVSKYMIELVENNTEGYLVERDGEVLNIALMTLTLIKISQKLKLSISEIIYSGAIENVMLNTNYRDMRESEFRNRLLEEVSTQLEDEISLYIIYKGVLRSRKKEIENSYEYIRGITAAYGN